MGAYRNNPCVNKPKMKVRVGTHSKVYSFVLFFEVGAHSLRERIAKGDAEN